MNPENQEPTAAEIAELDAATGSVEELPDGSAVVSYPEEESTPEDVEFSGNLAVSLLPSSVLGGIGIDLCELIDSDRTSRKERDKQQALGIQRTGLGNEAPGGADFDGASKTVHPMLAKGCVDFASKAIKELYPPGGPCKTQIIGESNEFKLDKAERKKTYINWQLTTQVPENRAEFEALLSQLPLGGSQYKRWWFDTGLKRLRTETVFIDDVFLPYNQNDFYTSYRTTHRQYVSAPEFDTRVRTGLYRDIANVSAAVRMDAMSESKQASDKIEGSEEDSTAYNEEGLREIYMCYVDLEIPEDDEAEEGRCVPYIVHCEAHTNKILGIYRNWKQGDDTFTRKPWMVEYKFIPWRGAQGIGLTHLIGSLSAAATGALRALLDAAHISNFPGGLKLKAGRTSGQNVTVNATELAELDAPPGVDDIRKLVMAFPFNGPSPVLTTLLDWLTNQAEGVVATASDRIADAGANMPMGTALALIEQGSVNFSAIHSRLHASLKRELEIVHRLNSEHLQDEEVVEELGELVVSREDFTGPMDIIPVSDPNIFSEAQRYAQLQAVMQLKADPTFAPFFPPEKLLRRALKLLNIPSVEDIANLPKEPSRLGPLEENYICCSAEPSPLKVYTDQEDLAHLEAHVHFMSSPMFGANQLIAPQALPVLINHCKDHLMSFYRKHSQSAADAMMIAAKQASLPLTQADAEAKGAAFADQLMAGLLAPTVMPALDAAIALAKSLTPPPQADPNMQLTSKTQAEVTQLQEATKEKLKKAELDYHKERDTLDREANHKAAAIAANIEQSKQELASAMAKFTVESNIMRDNLNNAAAVAAAELKATQEQMKSLLDGAIAQFGVPQQTSELIMQMATASSDQSAMLAGLADSVQTSNTDVQDMRQLVNHMLGIITAPQPGLMQRITGYTPQPGVPNGQGN